MGQRLVLSVTDRSSLGDLEDFVRTARAYGLVASSEFETMVTLEDDVHQATHVFDIPKNARVVNGKKIVLKPKSRKEQKVAEHIKAKKGAGEGYVPPEGRTTPPRIAKVVCPICGVKKPLQKVGALRVIKPHISQGEPCEGSGIQSSLPTKGKSSAK